MKTLWYYFIKIYIQIGLFFYTKKIQVSGQKNIPKKGAILFAVNHPNGLLDPLVVATHTTRLTHFLVQAAAFKNPIVKKLLASINLMPIYRIRDGRNEISKNSAIFNTCFDILNAQQALMIFPEGSHDKRRTVRTLSKGFTRIVFGAIDKFPDLKIKVVPVGITYQHTSAFPSRIALCFGKPLLANEYYNPKLVNESASELKAAVSNQLKVLSVHIPADEKYEKTLAKLNEKNVNFTEVSKINNAILKNDFGTKNEVKSSLKLLYFLWTANSFLPRLFWKKIESGIVEVEFIDTFKFAVGITIFPIFYAIQIAIVYTIFDADLAFYYALFTIISTLLYVKFTATLPKAHPE